MKLLSILLIALPTLALAQTSTLTPVAPQTYRTFTGATFRGFDGSIIASVYSNQLTTPETGTCIAASSYTNPPSTDGKRYFIQTWTCPSVTLTVSGYVTNVSLGGKGASGVRYNVTGGEKEVRN